MRKRYLDPWLAMGGLVIVVAAAAVLGLETSQRITPYSQAKAELNAAVHATTDLSSFTSTLEGLGYPQIVVVFQAPDRILVQQGQSRFLVVGRTMYVNDGRSGQQWIEQRAAREDFAQTYVMSYLQPLLRAVRVRQSGDHFRWIDHSAEGLPEEVTAVVTNGLVASEELRLPAASGFVGPRTLEIRFTSLGSSPPVTLPPRSDIAPGSKCENLLGGPNVHCLATATATVIAR